MKGELVQRVEYTPFGKERFVLNASLEELPKYTGQTDDIETDLYYYGSRYYDSVLGRFIQPDSIIADAYLSQSLNLYSYVINNPLKYIDPAGYAPVSHEYAEEHGTTPDAYFNGDNGVNDISGDAESGTATTGKTINFTADQAGANAVNKINYISIKKNREYAGWVYQEADGTYSYTDPIAGTIDSSNPGPKPSGKISGLYHTHGGNDPRYDNENFSSQDINVGNSLEVPMYLGTPLGVIRKYDPITGRVTNLPYPD